MASVNELSTSDLFRLFLLKFLDQTDVDTYEDETFAIGKFLDDTTGAIEVDTTVGPNA